MAIAIVAWAVDVSPAMLGIVAIVGVGLLLVAWFGVKFWLASTRPANIKEVQTPNLDRLNRRALEAMGSEEEVEEEEVPEGLKKVADEPGEEGK